MQILFDLESCSGDSPVRIFRWLDNVLDWLEAAAASGLNSAESLSLSVPAGFVLKTSPAYFPAAVVHSAASYPDDWQSTSKRSKRKARMPEVVSAMNAASGDSYIALIQDAISKSSSPDWGNWGMGGPIGLLTLGGSEFHSAAGVCSLSDVLETGDVPPKYFLSAKACRGILRRAKKRGRELPPALQAALLQAAESINQDDEEEMIST